MKVTFEVEGLKELEKNLLDLAKEYGPRNARNSLNTPLKKAIAPGEEYIRSNTPVRTGFTVSTTKTKAGRGPFQKSLKKVHGKGATRTHVNDIVAAATTGWRGGNFRGYVALEYGTRRQAPAHVISTAAERVADQMISEFKTEYDKSLTRTTKRLSKRKKLGKLNYR